MLASKFPSYTVTVQRNRIILRVVYTRAWVGLVNRVFHGLAGSALTSSDIFCCCFMNTVRCYLRDTLSTGVRLAQTGLKIFCRPGKATRSNLTWLDLLRSYDFLVERIFSSFFIKYLPERKQSPTVFT